MSDVSDLTKVRGKREETKASNRQAIIDAARIVFADLGYGATTVRWRLERVPGSDPRAKVFTHLA